MLRNIYNINVPGSDHKLEVYMGHLLVHLLQFYLICASLLPYVAFVLSLFVPDFPFWCLVSFCSCVCSVLLALPLPRLGKRELILVLFIRLFDLCLFGFVGFLFLLVSGKGCCDCGTPWAFVLHFWGYRGFSWYLYIVLTFYCLLYCQS